MELMINDLAYKNLLKDINLVFNSNEIIAIVGKNGSGKTLLLNLIACILKPTSGYIKIKTNNNQTIEFNNKSTHSIISYLEEPNKMELFNINVFEDITYQNKLEKSDIYSYLDCFNLDRKILDKNYIELSTSERDKVRLIKILSRNQDIILLDNPDSVLDFKSTQNLIKILKREKRKNKIIIFTSQDSDFILQSADRIIVLNNGKIAGDGKKYDVISNQQILSKANMDVPEIVEFENKVLELKNIKIGYRDNINDLIKDVYRNAK